MRCPACTVLLTPEVPCSARSCGWETDTGEVPLPCVHVKLLCLFQVVVGSWLDLFRSVYCDQVAPSGGECRPRGVYRGLRSPAALASPVLSVDPAVFTTAADARQLASSAGSRGERRPRGKHCGRRSPCSHICWPTRWREIRSISRAGTRQLADGDIERFLKCELGS